VELAPPVTVVGCSATETSVTAADAKFTAVKFAPLIMTFWLAGVKLNPLLLGVTV
jgi:hypothetical protein